MFLLKRSYVPSWLRIDMDIQKVETVESLLTLFFQTVRAKGGKTQYQPTSKQLLWWVETYGLAATEAGIRCTASILKKVPDKVVRSDRDAIYLVNYLNVCIKEAKTSIEPCQPST
jgi:hypothetical protein